MFLFLDLDNTILPSKQAYDYAIAELAKDWVSKQLGSESDFLTRYDKARASVKHQLAHHSSNRLRLLCFKHILDTKNKGINGEDIDLLLWFEERYYFHFGNSLRNKREESSEWIKLFALLKIIFDKQDVLVLTNENLRTQLMKLKAFFPAELRFNIITSEEVGIEKPSPDYFRYAMKKVDRKPSDCIMIGDNLIDDIQGANASGISGIHLKAIFGKKLDVKEITNEKDKIKNFETENIFSALEFALNFSA
jgi:putative hydrolase of the HAD superfamily